MEQFLMRGGTNSIPEFTAEEIEAEICKLEKGR
jgi:hypothetical protein